MVRQLVGVLKMKNIYQENGFLNRTEYLKSLADDFGIDFITLATIASMLGADEDFDGLVTWCEDNCN